ncbi:MAG: Gfo/Idh/MocA family oxidoreductase [Gammaproteobacteria bacterium]
MQGREALTAPERAGAGSPSAARRNAGRRLAIIGCGAVAERYHQPVLSLRSDVEVALLVDKNPARTERLAQSFPQAECAQDLRAVAACGIDAALVTVPHHLHAPVALELMDAGISVLVEKPMAMNTAECRAMLDAARRNAVTLAVGMQRRFSRSCRLVKQILDSGMLGAIQEFDLREGDVYGWQSADKAMLSKELGGGVLTGIGIHSMDLLLWWFGDAVKVEYYDDALGGVEAECEFHLEMTGGASGVLAFSRLRKMRNTWRIRGTRGSLELGMGWGAAVRLTVEGSDLALAAVHDGGEQETAWNLLRYQMDDFLDAVRTGREPVVSGAEGMRAIALMEAGQHNRRPLVQPWMLP